VKKILSILLTLGMVLGLVVIAAPVSADVTGPGGVGTPDVTFPAPLCNCAGLVGCYQIEFDISASVEEGVHEICIEFPDDTVVPATFAPGDITIEGVNVIPSEITVTDTAYGTMVCMIWPGDPVIGDLDLADNPITVVFTAAADIKNPTTPGTYNLYVHTTRVADSNPVISDPYTIVPQITTYDLTLDFSPTYPGLIPGYVPPFKACGQEGYGIELVPGQWFTIFDLIFDVDVLGCADPCPTANMWWVLEACPPGEIVSLSWDGGPVLTYDENDVDVVQPLPAVTLALAPYIWTSAIHFSSPGNYTICWYVECPTAPCGPGPQIIAKVCIDAVVYQWKNAWCIELWPKWNLISLPLFPFNTDIEAVLAPLSAPDQLMSVWYFDQCADDDPNTGAWYVYPPKSSLGTMEAGKAYWIRMKHPGDPGYNPALFPATLWMWGHHAPMPPADPMAWFEVCEGWNMVGFKPPWDLTTGPFDFPVPEDDEDYLWNWWDIMVIWPDYGTIYEWDAFNQEWLWGYPFGYTLWPGLGYWIPFDHDGEIYPKP
jgi:hypothetical protein